MRRGGRNRAGGFRRTAGQDRALGAGAAAAASASLLACAALVAPDAVEAQARQVLAVVTPTPARSSVKRYVRIEESFTDNANLSVNARSDTITRALAGVAAQIESGRVQAALRAEYAYDWYARHEKLNGGTVYANGSAAYALLRDRLWLEGDGTVSQVHAASFPFSGADRAGTPGRTRLAIYRIGPRLAARLGNFADLVATVRSQWVSYGADDGGALPDLPPDANILQAMARVDTAQRFGRYQLLTTASLVRDDDAYRAANAVQSAFVRVSPRTRLIARAGYERIRERAVIDLDAPVVSAGVEFRPNATSRLSLEGGRRYDRTAWNAKADFRVAKAILVAAEYYETLSPSQIQAANSFERFVDQTRDLPAPVVPQTFSLRENIYNQTSYNKVAEVHAVYGGPRQSLDLSGRWSRRRFIDSGAQDETLYGSALYTRRIRPDLEVGLEANYARTFDSPIYGESKSYGGAARVLYRLNTSTDLNASYHRMRGSQRISGGATHENLFRISLEKRF